MKASERNDGIAFERLCLEILENFGWIANLTPEKNDRGLDIIATRRFSPSEFKIGCQCKAYKRDNVSSGEVRDFAGALIQAKLKEGWFFSLSDFTAEAKLAAETINQSNQTKIVLINESDLSKLHQDSITTREILVRATTAYRSELESRVFNLKKEFNQTLKIQAQTLTNRLDQVRQTSELKSRKLKESLTRGFKALVATNAIALIILFFSASYLKALIHTPEHNIIAPFTARPNAGNTFPTLNQPEMPLTAKMSFSQKAIDRNKNSKGKIGKIVGRVSIETTDTSRSYKSKLLTKNYESDSDPFHRELPKLLSSFAANEICKELKSIQVVEAYLALHDIKASKKEIRSWNRILISRQACNDSIPHVVKEST